MDTLDQSLMVSLVEMWNTVHQMSFFRFFVWIFIVYAVVLTANIILLIFSRNLGSDIRSSIVGTNFPTQAEVRRRWKSIERHLQKNDPALMLAAILEADKLVMDILSRVGYSGSFIEQCATLERSNVPHADLLCEAHAIAEQIVTKTIPKLDFSETKDVIERYRSFLVGLELLN